MTLPFWGWFASDESVQAIVDEAAKVGGFSPEQASPELAMKGLRVPALLIHGESDFLIPLEHSRRLYSAGLLHATLCIIDGLGHNASFADRNGTVRNISSRWFKRWFIEEP